MNFKNKQFDWFEQGFRVRTLLHKPYCSENTFCLGCYHPEPVEGLFVGVGALRQAQRYNNEWKEQQKDCNVKKRYLFVRTNVFAFQNLDKNIMMC